MVRFSVVRFGNGPFWLWDANQNKDFLSYSYLINIHWVVRFFIQSTIDFSYKTTLYPVISLAGWTENNP
jgi:hypothetical protein